MNEKPYIQVKETQGQRSSQLYRNFRTGCKTRKSHQSVFNQEVVTTNLQQGLFLDLCNYLSPTFLYRNLCFLSASLGVSF